MLTCIPRDGDELTCYRDIPGRDELPSIAKGDRATYLGHSQIRMLDGAAKDWVFSMLITAPFALSRPDELY